MLEITSKPRTVTTIGTGVYQRTPIPTPAELEEIAEGIRRRNGTDAQAKAPVDHESSDARIAALAATLANQTGTDRRVCHMLFTTLKRLAAVEHDLELARGCAAEFGQRLAALEKKATPGHLQKIEKRA
jgi:hypothetical protein